MTTKKNVVKVTAVKQARLSILPLLTIDDGVVESMKWLALVLMTLDHVNKYLLQDAYPVIFDMGRVATPLFGFVLAYNLARPGMLGKGAYLRVIKRLVLFGAIATAPFIALGGLAWGWYPFNIMWMLVVSTVCIYLIDQGGKLRIALALLFFIVGGAVVEFWWPAVGICIAAWLYCKRPGVFSLAFWIASTAALVIINRNYWALAVFPIIFAAPFVRVKVPRMKMVFYAYYPMHLTIIWLFSRLLQIHL